MVVCPLKQRDRDRGGGKGQEDGQLLEARDGGESGECVLCDAGGGST